jgi:hypothetical protein
LCRNNYYYAVLIESAPTPPSTFPHQHTGIADSGSSSFYFSCGALVANYNPRALTVSITVANQCPNHSVASATLASISALPPAIMSGYVMPSFSHTLIGLDPFAIQGCKIVHVTPRCLVFGNDHSPKVVSEPQQPLLPPSAPVFPVREPIAHCIRFRAPAPLALFVSGGRSHGCVQYHIPTARSLHSPLVAMGFACLCTVHHMMTAETTNFAALCSALLHKDSPLALSALDPTTGNILEHCQLCHDPWYKTTWDTSYANELDPLCQGISSEETPNSKHVASTNTFFCINYHDIPLHKRKKICHTMVVCEVRPDKNNPNPHGSPLVAIASATLAMWVLTQHPWNFSSSSSTVYSLEKVHA